jgi:hypothetical protein
MLGVDQFRVCFVGIAKDILSTNHLPESDQDEEFDSPQ